MNMEDWRCLEQHGGCHVDSASQETRVRAPAWRRRRRRRAAQEKHDLLMGLTKTTCILPRKVNRIRTQATPGGPLIESEVTGLLRFVLEMSRRR